MNKSCNNKNHIKSKLISGFSILAIAISGSLNAAEVPKQSDFNIKSGDLKSALKQYMKQSGKQVVFLDEHVVGKNSASVVGNLNNQEALTQLLQDTNLVVNVDKSTGAILIKKAYSEKKARTEVVTAAVEKTSEQPTSTATPNNTNLDEEDETEIITVTGSRIVGVAPTSPIVTISKEEMDARGIANMEQLLRYLPQNYNSSHSGGGMDGKLAGSDAPNATTINLKGLGNGATLVLINGKRISSSAADSNAYTDVSNIPFAAIERIEVLTDGASAIYGSDAVAGVVNFILKDGYHGYDVSVRYEDSSSGGDKKQFQLSGGFDWDSGNFTGSISATKSDPVNVHDAGISLSGDFTEQGGDDRHINTNGIAGVVDSTEKFRRSLRSTATPDSEQLSLYGMVTQELTEDIELSVSSIYSEIESESHMLHDASSFFYFTGGERLIAWNYAFSRETQAGMIKPGYSKNKSKRFNVDTTLDWTLPYKDWGLEFSVSHGYDENYANERRLNARGDNAKEAFGSMDFIDGQIVITDGTYDFVNLSNNSSSLYESLYENVYTGVRRGEQTTFSSLLTGSLMELSAGDVKFSVGAEMRNEKSDWTDYRLNPLDPSLDFLKNPALENFVPEVDNVSAYVELYTPIVDSEMNIPLVKYLAFSFAVRYDDYSVDGPFAPLVPGQDVVMEERTYDETVTKLGVIWEIDDSLSVSLNIGEAFQAPTLGELFQPVYNEIDIYGNAYANDPFNPESNGGPGPTFFYEGEFLRGGNSNLKPQTSVTTSVGLQYNSQAIEGLRIATTYTNTEFKDLIESPSSIYYGTPFMYDPSNNLSYIERNAEGVLIKDNSGLPTNIGSFTSDNLEIDATYDFQSDIGDFRLGVFATHVMKLDYKVDGLETLEQGGYFGGPAEWKSRVYVDWYLGNWSANAKVNYDGDYKVRADDGSENVADVDSYTTVDLQVNYSFDGWKLSGGVNNLLDEDFPFVHYDEYGYDSSRVDLRRRVIYLNVTKTFDF